MKIKPRFFEEDCRYSEGYEQHLERFPKLLDSNVFRSFGEGFFHDGEIENIILETCSRIVSFNITAPNFKIQETGDYLSVRFNVRFQGVEYFQLDMESEEEPSLVENLTFLRAEFNTLGISPFEELLSYFDRSFSDSGKCEMILDCVGSDDVKIALNFSEFEIRPESFEMFYLVSKECDFDHNYFSA